MHRLILTIFFVVIILKCNGQGFLVGDIIKADTIKLIATKSIQGQTITFIEDKFTLKMSRLDILNELKQDSANNDSLFRNMYKVVLNYLASKNNFTFKYIWTKADLIK